MATVNAVVYEHHKKADGTYNVKIKIFHQKKRAHIETSHYVSPKQLDKNLQIKDKFLLRILESTLEDYRHSISELGPELNSLLLTSYGTISETKINLLTSLHSAMNILLC